MAGHHLLLFDGVCGLCTRLNRFVLQRDRRDVFRFAALQGDVGRRAVERFGRDPDAITTLLVVADFDGAAPRLLARSDAAFFIARELGGVAALAALLRVFPRALTDAAYDGVARRRYRWFGELDACPTPSAADRAKFLDAT